MGHMESTAIAEEPRTARVLVFGVDDGHFCMPLDRVEGVYSDKDIELYAVKTAVGVVRRFLLHHGQPALVVDLREAFGLHEILGTSDRSAFLVVRAGGSFQLAVQVDACIGVRELDLRTKVPVAANLVRDGGLSVGYLVELDGKLHVLIEPNRILSASLREQLEPVLRDAIAFRDRQNKIALLAEELRREPNLIALKTYGRLSRRNGRARTATATRLVLKAAQESQSQAGQSSVAGDLAADTLLRDLITLSTAQQTGELVFQLPDGGEGARILFDAGLISDAHIGGEWGRGALKRILAQRQGAYRFVRADTPNWPRRIKEATLWLLVGALEHLSEERRLRQAR
jgi:chemotaxis signal transduction protein